MPMDWSSKKCSACEGGVDLIDGAAAQELLADFPKWSLSDDSLSIVRKIDARNFMRAIGMVREIAEISETEGHHPDLHLTGYRNLKIVLTTHAIGGLSENDFILAAKFDQLITA
jgi:4a-hydroxytetrahydrobiopterin dehydratase